MGIIKNDDLIVGRLSKSPNTNKAIVLVVLRYPQTRDMDYFQKNDKEYEKLTDEVQNRGWLWIVCIQGN